MTEKTLRQQAEEEARILVDRYNVMYLILLADAIERLTRKKMDKMKIGKL